MSRTSYVSMISSALQGGTEPPPDGPQLLWVIAGPIDTTFTRLARKIDPAATAEQITALAKANGYAVTTAAKPGMIYFWTTDIFPERNIT